jgi:ferredoxin
MGLNIDIDRDVCIGSGNCGFEAPGVFTLDDDGIAVVVDASAAPEDKVMAAARKCPSKAISVRPISVRPGHE